MKKFLCLLVMFFMIAQNALALGVPSQIDVAAEYGILRGEAKGLEEKGALPNGWIYDEHGEHPKFTNGKFNVPVPLVGHGARETVVNAIFNMLYINKYDKWPFDYEKRNPEDADPVGDRKAAKEETALSERKNVVWATYLNCLRANLEKEEKVRQQEQRDIELQRLQAEKELCEAEDLLIKGGKSFAEFKWDDSISVFESVLKMTTNSFVKQNAELFLVMAQFNNKKIDIYAAIKNIEKMNFKEPFIASEQQKKKFDDNRVFSFESVKKQIISMYDIYAEYLNKRIALRPELEVESEEYYKTNISDFLKVINFGVDLLTIEEEKDLFLFNIVKLYMFCGFFYLGKNNFSEFKSNFKKFIFYSGKMNSKNIDKLLNDWLGIFLTLISEEKNILEYVEISYDFLKVFSNNLNKNNFELFSIIVKGIIEKYDKISSYNLDKFSSIIVNIQEIIALLLQHDYVINETDGKGRKRFWEEMLLRLHSATEERLMKEWRTNEGNRKNLFLLGIKHNIPKIIDLCKSEEVDPKHLDFLEKIPVEKLDDYQRFNLMIIYSETSKKEKDRKIALEWLNKAEKLFDGNAGKLNIVKKFLARQRADLFYLLATEVVAKEPKKKQKVVIDEEFKYLVLGFEQVYMYEKDIYNSFSEQEKTKQFKFRADYEKVFKKIKEIMIMKLDAIKLSCKEIEETFLHGPRSDVLYNNLKNCRELLIKAKNPFDFYKYYLEFKIAETEAKKYCFEKIEELNYGNVLGYTDVSCFKENEPCVFLEEQKKVVLDIELKKQKDNEKFDSLKDYLLKIALFNDDFVALAGKKRGDVLGISTILAEWSETKKCEFWKNKAESLRKIGKVIKQKGQFSVVPDNATVPEKEKDLNPILKEIVEQLEQLKIVASQA